MDYNPDWKSCIYHIKNKFLINENVMRLTLKAYQLLRHMNVNKITFYKIIKDKYCFT